MRLADSKIHNRRVIEQVLLVQLHELGGPWCLMHVTQVGNHVHVDDAREKEDFLCRVRRLLFDKRTVTF